MPAAKKIKKEEEKKEKRRRRKKAKKEAEHKAYGKIITKDKSTQLRELNEKWLP